MKWARHVEHIESGMHGFDGETLSKEATRKT